MKKSISVALLCFGLALPGMARGHNNKSTYTVGPHVVHPYKKQAPRTAKAPVRGPNNKSTYTVAPHVVRPYEMQAPRAANATGVCKDGTLNYTQDRRGACSHHGGIRTWNWSAPSPLLK